MKVNLPSTHIRFSEFDAFRSSFFSFVGACVAMIEFFKLY